MGLIASSIFLDTMAFLTTTIALIYTYFFYMYNYWHRQGIPYEKASIPFGSIPSPTSKAREHNNLVMRRWYNKHKKLGHKHYGHFLLDKPMYTPIDVEIIRCIVTRDFEYFKDRGLYYNEKSDPVGAHLVTLTGNKWKYMRGKISPAFSSGKMKMMFNTLVECGQEMMNLIERKRLEQSTVDAKEVTSCYGTDVIGSCAFGLECNSFKDENSPFRVYGRKMFAITMLRRVVTFSFPNVCRALGVRLISPDVSNFIMSVVKETVGYRENNNVQRNDFLQLLIDIKNKKNHETDDDFTIEKLAAQVYAFFAAGYETTATTITFCLFELAKNRQVQSKVREEVKAVLKNHDGKLSYEAIQEMKYLSQVVDETLRMYPAVSQLNRVAAKDYKVPGTDLVLKKGQAIWISTISLHYDEEYFPDPEKFDPERFSDENKRKIKPFTYMPFGEGPRNCVGLRFGIMQTKVALVTMLKNYEFLLNKDTKLPLRLNPATPFTAAADPILFDVKKVE